MSVEQETASAHAGVVVTYAGLAGVLALARRRRRHRLPVPNISDVFLLGLASYRLSRVVSRDKVLDFARAPFTEPVAPGHASEVVVKPKGRGWRRAVGELIGCPFCISVWVATGLGYLYLFAPRAARAVAAVGAAVTVADATQYGMEALKKRAA